MITIIIEHYQLSPSRRNRFSMMESVRAAINLEQLRSDLLAVQIKVLSRLRLVRNRNR
jgi:hypothetical protein